MSRHLEQINYARTVMVQKRYPVKLIQLMTMIYLQGLKDEARMEQEIREERKARRLLETLLSYKDEQGTDEEEPEAENTPEAEEETREIRPEETAGVISRGKSGDA